MILDWLMKQVPDAAHALVYASAGLPATIVFFYRLVKVPGSRVRGNFGAAAAVYSAIFTFTNTVWLLITGKYPYEPQWPEKLSFLLTALIVTLTAASQGLRGTSLGDWFKLQISRHFHGADFVSPSHPLVVPLQELGSIQEAFVTAGADVKAIAIAKARFLREDATIRAVLMRLRDRKAIEPEVCVAIQAASDACQASLGSREPDSIRECIAAYCGLINGGVVYIPALAKSG